MATLFYMNSGKSFDSGLDMQGIGPKTKVCRLLVE